MRISLYNLRLIINKIVSFFENPKVQLLVVVLIGLLVSIQSLLEGTRAIDGGVYTHYNNYLIFKQSFYHLIGGMDLYAYYAKEHFDLFKYSSTFASLFGVFAVFPDFIGLPLWNLFNLLFFYFALKSVPQLSNRWVGVILLLSLLELITTTQNEQSNTLMLGLFLFTFSSLEKKRYLWACLFVLLAVYTKLYGIVAFSLFLLYPGKIRSFFYTIFWAIVLFFVPLIFIDFKQLIFNYQSWFALLSIEHGQIYGISVMGWLHTWFGLSIHKIIPVVIGVILFCLPLLRIKNYKIPAFRLMLLTSILIWVVIFNHRAESASYIIAYIGICFWFAIAKPNLLRSVLMISAFVLITLSPTDLFPKFLRENVVQAYTLKAVPAIFIWLKVLWDMWFMSNNDLFSNAHIEKLKT